MSVEKAIFETEGEGLEERSEIVSPFPTAKDFLATAAISFTLGAPTLAAASQLAGNTLSSFVEEDDLIGAGAVQSLVRDADATWLVGANVLFRAQGDDLADARAFAEGRVGDIIAANGFISEGALVSIEDDVS